MRVREQRPGLSDDVGVLALFRQVVVVDEEPDLWPVHRFHERQSLAGRVDDVGFLLAQRLHDDRDAVVARDGRDAPAEVHQLGECFVPGEAIRHAPGAAAAEDHHLHTEPLEAGERRGDIGHLAGRINVGPGQLDRARNEAHRGRQGNLKMRHLGRELLEFLVGERGHLRGVGLDIVEPGRLRGFESVGIHTDPNLRAASRLSGCLAGQEQTDEECGADFHGKSISDSRRDGGGLSTRRVGRVNGPGSPLDGVN